MGGHSTFKPNTAIKDQDRHLTLLHTCGGAHLSLNLDLAYHFSWASEPAFSGDSPSLPPTGGDYRQAAISHRFM